MTRLWAAAALACCLLTLPRTGLGQVPRRASGFWLGLGGGIGPGGFDCDVCAGPEGSTGPTGMLSLGRTLSSKLALGIQVSGWRKRAAAEVEHLSYVTASAYLFPLQRSGFHLDAGVGVARGTSEIERGDNGGTNRASTLSPAWRVGAGFDVPLGREVSVTPLVEYFMGTSAELKIDGAPSGVRIANHLLQVGLGLHWNFSGEIGIPHPTSP